MTVARTVADVLADHVVFEVECIDRMYCNVYVIDRLPGRARLRRVRDTQRVSLVGRHESVLLLNLGSGLTQTI